MLKIQVVGPGCINCENLYKMCIDIAAENNLDVDIQKITNPDEFANLGIWLTPGLIVNGKILLQGKIPTKSTLEHRLSKLA